MAKYWAIFDLETPDCKQIVENVMQKHKHLFFDLDNTLFDFSASANIVLEKVYYDDIETLGFESYQSFRQIYDRINDGLWADYRLHKINKDAVKYGRFHQTLLEKGIDNSDLARYVGDKFVDNCTDSDILVADAKEVIEKLSKSYQLHIVSNGFIEAQYRKLEITGLKPFFQGITLSEEVKVQKPHRQFFEEALKKVNARKKESVVIGDSWRCDIEGALNFGMEAIYFSYDGKAPKNNEIPTVYRLIELLDIL